MSKINKLNTLAETKFLSLYNAEYSNKGGNTKNWTIASRKEKKNLEEVYLNNKEYDKYIEDKKEYLIENDSFNLNDIYNYLKNKEGINPHLVNPIYIKGIDALNDK